MYALSLSLSLILDIWAVDNNILLILLRSRTIRMRNVLEDAAPVKMFIWTMDSKVSSRKWEVKGC